MLVIFVVVFDVVVIVNGHCRCVLASLKKGGSVAWSVGRSVGPSVSPSVGPSELNFEVEFPSRI